MDNVFAEERDKRRERADSKNCNPLSRQEVRLDRVTGIIRGMGMGMGLSGEGDVVDISE